MTPKNTQRLKEMFPMFTAESRHIILTQTLALSRGRESWREKRPRGASARQKLGRPVHAVTELLCIDNKCKIRSKMRAPSHLDTIHMLLKPSGTSDEINIDLQNLNSSHLTTFEGALGLGFRRETCSN